MTSAPSAAGRPSVYQPANARNWRNRMTHLRTRRFTTTHERFASTDDVRGLMPQLVLIATVLSFPPRTRELSHCTLGYALLPSTV